MNFGEHGMLDIIIEKNNSNNIQGNKSDKNDYLINSEKNKNNLENNYLNNKKINKIKINFIKLDNRIFEEKNINISEINSEEELIEKINLIKINENIFCKIILTGTRNIEINKNKICKLIQNNNILKIEDKTETKYNFDELSEQNNLKGIFIKKMLQKLNDKNLDQDEIKRAIEIGLKSFE